MLRKAIITGWLEYNLITYLQKRNPSVPGISSKLSPPTERKLDRAKKFWRSVIEYKQDIGANQRECTHAPFPVSPF